MEGTCNAPSRSSFRKWRTSCCCLGMVINISLRALDVKSSRHSTSSHPMDVRGKWRGNSWARVLVSWRRVCKLHQVPSRGGVLPPSPPTLEELPTNGGQGVAIGWLMNLDPPLASLQGGRPEDGKSIPIFIHSSCATEGVSKPLFGIRRTLLLPVDGHVDHRGRVLASLGSWSYFMRRFPGNPHFH